MFLSRDLTVCFFAEKPIEGRVVVGVAAEHYDEGVHDDGAANTFKNAQCVARCVLKSTSDVTLWGPLV